MCDGGKYIRTPLDYANKTDISKLLNFIMAQSLLEVLSVDYEGARDTTTPSMALSIESGSEAFHRLESSLKSSPVIIAFFFFQPSGIFSTAEAN